MFKAIFKVAAWVLFCLLALSCSKDGKGSDVLAYLSADDAFVEGQARLDINLTEASSSDVTVTLGVGDVKENALKSSCIGFSGNPVTISAGATEATITLTLNSEGLENGRYQAVISIINVTGATAHKTLDTIYIDAEISSGVQ